jgi:hypothetical protein
MSDNYTSRDVRQATFVESLSNSLKRAARTISDNEKFISLASSYMEDGLDESECIELLMIDGISREAAESCVLMVSSENAEDDGLEEYSFRFEDGHGKVWSSFDINRTIKAASTEDAALKAEELFEINPEMAEVTPVKIVSVNRI